MEEKMPRTGDAAKQNAKIRTSVVGLGLRASVSK